MKAGQHSKERGCSYPCFFEPCPASTAWLTLTGFVPKVVSYYSVLLCTSKPEIKIFAPVWPRTQNIRVAEVNIYLGDNCKALVDIWSHPLDRF